VPECYGSWQAIAEDDAVEEAVELFGVDAV
jgi:hypothetical protein